MAGAVVASGRIGFVGGDSGGVGEFGHLARVHRHHEGQDDVGTVGERGDRTGHRTARFRAARGRRYEAQAGWQGVTNRATGRI